MRIFVCEFITGGGLYRESLPPSLALEGELMLQALLDELMDIPELSIRTTRDYRKPALSTGIEVVEISPEINVWECWAEQIAQADAVWLIAPESNGILEKLSLMVTAAGKVLLGSAPSAVAIAARKSTTSKVLSLTGVDVVPTWTLPASEGHAGPWVAKPDDGAGCEDTCLFDRAEELNDWLSRDGRMQSHVVQPLLQGQPASISMLCRNGEAWVLSCNSQKVRMRENQFSYHGSVLNGMASHWNAFELLARQVAVAAPGLAGYIGVDVMVSGQGVTVLEINPRLTTSFVGMRRATGLNTARLVLDLFYNQTFEFPQTMMRNVVEVSLEESQNRLF